MRGYCYIPFSKEPFFSNKDLRDFDIAGFKGFRLLQLSRYFCDSKKNLFNARLILDLADFTLYFGRILKHLCLTISRSVWF